MQYRNKPYENILAGFYDFGDYYFVNLDEQLKHNAYTELHERTHLNLGTSSSLGLFHKFWYRLITKTEFNSNQPNFLVPIFNLAIEEARDIHEAAANFKEFAIAEYYEYQEINEMIYSLPPEYVVWKGIFENKFDKSIPLLVQGWLSEHIARIVLDIDIFNKFLPSSNDFIKDFTEYIGKDRNNPNKRLDLIFKVLAKINQQELFKEYLQIYNDNSKELILSYQVRNIENRRFTFKIQSELFNAFQQYTVKRLFHFVPELDYSYLSSGQIIADANNFSKVWCNYFNEKINGFEFNFKFTNTDTNATFDILDYNLGINPIGKPQSNLVPIDDFEVLKFDEICIIRLWIRLNEEPFLLSSNPTRYLYKGDKYLRLISPKYGDNSFFMIKKNDDIIPNLFNRSNCGVIVDGHDYKLITSKWNDSRSLKNSKLIFYWKYPEEILVEIFNNKTLKLGIYTVNQVNGIILLFKSENDNDNVFHIVFTLNGGADVVLERLREKSKGIEFINIDVNDDINIILEYAIQNLNFVF